MDRLINQTGGSADTDIGKKGQKEIPKIMAWTNLAEQGVNKDNPEQGRPKRIKAVETGNKV